MDSVGTTAKQFMELARARRTVRAFDSERPVSDAHVEFLLEAARWAPSAGNSQPWHFVVIRDPDDRAFNSQLFREQAEDKKKLEKAVRGQARRTAATFDRAPVQILVLGDPRVRTAYPVRTALEKSDRHLHVGLANATLLIMLAATSVGLGARFVSDASSPYMSTMLRLRYGIPDTFLVHELVPVGWPSRETEAKPRRPLDEIVHQGRFDPEKFLSTSDLRAYLWKEGRLGSYGTGPSDRAVRWDDPLHDWW